MTNKFTNWRDAWKTDDTDWVKQRQKEWREVSKSPFFKADMSKNLFTRKEKTQIKNYFMTGCGYIPEPAESEWEYMGYDPLRNPLQTRARALLRCWLHPVVDIDFWNYIKSLDRQNFNVSRDFFRYQLKYSYPMKGTLFTGRDKELYYFFTPTRCRPEDYPDRPPEGYFIRASSSLFDLHNLIDKYLNEDNPDSIASDVFPEWNDAVVPTFIGSNDVNKKHHLIKLSATLAQTKSILQNESDFSEGQLAFANRLIDTFKGMDFPEGMESIDEFLNTV
jgi:hypothetical protein